MKSFLLIVGLVPGIVTAQAPPVTVAVQSAVAQDDMVGGRLVYALKEQIRKSHAFRLVPEADSAAITIHIASMDPDRSSRGFSSIASVVWTLGASMLWKHEVITTGSNRVEERAEDLLADTDRISDEIRATIKGR